MGKIYSKTVSFRHRLLVSLVCPLLFSTVLPLLNFQREVVFHLSLKFASPWSVNAVTLVSTERTLVGV